LEFPGVPAARRSSRGALADDGTVLVLASATRLFALQRGSSPLCQVAVGRPFQGRALLPNAVAPQFLEEFKTKHKDINVNARCTALGRILARRSRRQRLPGQHVARTATSRRQVAQHAHHRLKVGGDTSPVQPGDHALRRTQLKVDEEGNKKVTKQMAIDGKHAMYVVSKALLKKLELDADQESSKTPMWPRRPC
jgi:hypothetical protein